MLKVEREMAKKVMLKKLDDNKTVLLISYVQAKACLWDEKHADFKRISITRKLWNEIGAQLHITGDDARNKWKTLREKFKKLLTRNSKENNISGSSTAAPPWKFYNSLLFLKDSLQAEPVHLFAPMANKNVSKERILKEQKGEKDDDFEEFDFDYFVQSTSDKDIKNRKPGPLSSKRKITSNGEVSNKFENAEEMKSLIPPTVVQQDERSGNDDQHFLLSLMPYIQALDPVEKLELRSQMQNLVTTSFKKHESNKRSRLNR